jgi:hypothetical protein
MAQLLALVTTTKRLLARLAAVGDTVLASFPSAVRNLTQGRLATRTTGDDIGRARAVRRLRVLWVTGLLARVFATVIGATAFVGTFKRSNPVLNRRRAVSSEVRLTALLLLLSITATYVLLYLSAVASCWDADIASTAGSFVARPRAAVLATRHQLATDFSAAPAMLVVCVGAAARDRFLTAETVLSGSHQSAGRTRPSMARHGTWMRTFLWQNSWASARLTAGEGWESGKRLWIQLLLTPTVEVLG